jgi:hypothetical protein
MWENGRCHSFPYFLQSFIKSRSYIKKLKLNIYQDLCIVILKQLKSQTRESNASRTDLSKIGISIGMKGRKLKLIML